MKNFSLELYKRAQRAENGYEILMARVEEFLDQLEITLKCEAKKKKYQHLVLKVASMELETLSDFEKEVFAGCKNLNLKTKIIQLPDGFFIFVTWYLQ